MVCARKTWTRKPADVTLVPGPEPERPGFGPNGAQVEKTVEARNAQGGRTRRRGFLRLQGFSSGFEGNAGKLENGLWINGRSPGREKRTEIPGEINVQRSKGRPCLNPRKFREQIPTGTRGNCPCNPPWEATERNVEIGVPLESSGNRSRAWLFCVPFPFPGWLTTGKRGEKRR